VDGMWSATGSAHERVQAMVTIVGPVRKRRCIGNNFTDRLNVIEFIMDK